jgi:hypothetical protein
VTAHHIQSFFYSMGRWMAHQRDYERSMSYFSLAFSLPAQMATSLAVDAYKRYILISLIHTGQVRIKTCSTARTAQIVVRHVASVSMASVERARMRATTCRCP